jgi:hypothetical protein
MTILLVRHGETDGNAARVLQRADSDEAGQAFQYEAGHLYRSGAGHDSDLKPAMWREFSAGHWDDVFDLGSGQAHLKEPRLL